MIPDRLTLVGLESPKPAAGERSTFHVIRELTANEVAEFARSARVFRQMTVRSEFKNLEQACKSLHDSESALERNYRRDRDSIHGDTDRLHREFKHFLSAFRSFDDRTAHWISGEFGTDSVALTSFRSRLSEEYDRSFAYRFCYAMRNVAEHVVDVINDIRVSSWVSAPGAESQYDFVIAINPRELAVSAPDIKSSVRDELVACGGSLDVDLIVGEAMQSCERAFGGLALALRPTLERLLDFTDSLEREATQLSGEIGVVVDAADLERLGFGHTELTIRENPVHLGSVLRKNLEVAQVLCSRPVSPVGTEHLTV